MALCLGARYQLRAAPARDEAEAPAEKHEQPVLEADQIEEVQPEPEQPGRQSRDVHAFEVGNRARAADRREVALVVVTERPRGLIAEAPADRAG